MPLRDTRRRLPFRLDQLPWLRSQNTAFSHSGSGDDEWEGADPHPGEPEWGRFWAKTLGVGLGMALLAGALWFFFGEGRDRQTPSPSLPLAAAVPADSPPAPGSIQAETNEVKRVIARFLAADNLEEKLACVLPAEGIEERMGRYYEAHPARARAIFDYPIIMLKMAEGGTFYAARALTTDGVTRHFVVRPSRDGMRIDWESHVAYSELDWDPFIDDQPAGSAEFRVYAELAELQIPPFDDRSTYLPLVLTRPGSTRLLMAVIEKENTSGAREFSQLLVRSKKPHPVLLRLSFPPQRRGAKTPVARVDAFLQEGWLSLPSTGAQLTAGTAAEEE